MATLIKADGCFYLCKNTNLKAIHNVDDAGLLTDGDVSTYAKILIWKRFTTEGALKIYEQMMFLPMQKY